MGKLGGPKAAALGLLLIWLTAAFAGCGSSPTTTTNFPVPARIILTPSNIVSLEVGLTQSFTAQPQTNKQLAINEPVSFQSSNTAVVTVAANGNACAGSWDSLTSPQICTPGAVGVAQVTASARSVSSPPTVVYVHQHIDHIEVSPIPGQTLVPSDCGVTGPPGFAGFSKDRTFNYQATAFSQGTDITSTVGTFIWQSANSVVASVSTSAAGLLTGQVQVKANTPGLTSIFASASNVNSEPFAFMTCPIQSIALAVTGSSSNTVSVPKGTAQSITPTVIDTLGTTITGVPLSWCSSEPTLVSAGTTNCATNTGTSVSVTTPQAGGGTIIASCTPPTCNIGLQHLPPFYPEEAVIYPQQAVNFIISQGTTAAPSNTAYVSSTDCGTSAGCESKIVTLAAPSNTPGAPLFLPATPNSLVFDHQGQKAFLGTNFGFFGTRGLMQLNVTASPPTVSQVKGLTGKVLAISPDGKKVILAGTDSNTDPTPTKVSVFDTTNNSSTDLPIAGATAADFSPDSLKAFVVAGNTIFVYSTVDSLQSVPLSSAASNVSFLAEGAFAYLAGGASPDGVAVLRTCDHAVLPFVLPTTPFAIKTLPDSSQMLAVNSPSVSIEAIGVTSGVTTTPVGCNPTVVNGPVTSFDFGQGSFIPIQLIVSTDGTRAYVIPSNLSSVLVFDVQGKTTFAIPLAPCVVQVNFQDTCNGASPTPIQAALTSDGNFLYVAAKDGAVHVLNVQTREDIQQIAFTKDVSTLNGGLCAGVPSACNPNLIAVRP